MAKKLSKGNPPVYPYVATCALCATPTLSTEGKVDKKGLVYCVNCAKKVAG